MQGQYETRISGAQSAHAGTGVNSRPRNTSVLTTDLRKENIAANTRHRKRHIVYIIRKGFELIFGCATTKPKQALSEDHASIADDATLAPNDRIGYMQSEDGGFARTLEIVYCPEYGDDILKYGVVVFDSGSSYNFVTAEWLQSNRLPFERFPDGPRVVATSLQGAQITAIGEIKDLKFARPRNQPPIEDVAGNEISLKQRFWKGDFYILASNEATIDEKTIPYEPIEFIVGTETIRRYDLYRPSPMLMMAPGIRPVEDPGPKTTVKTPSPETQK